MALFRATIYYLKSFVDENNVILVELDSPEMARAVKIILHDRVFDPF